MSSSGNVQACQAVLRFRDIIHFNSSDRVQGIVVKQWWRKPSQWRKRNTIIVLSHFISQNHFNRKVGDPNLMAHHLCTHTK